MGFDVGQWCAAPKGSWGFGFGAQIASERCAQFANKSCTPTFPWPSQSAPSTLELKWRHPHYGRTAAVRVYVITTIQSQTAPTRSGRFAKRKTWVTWMKFQCMHSTGQWLSYHAMTCPPHQATLHGRIAPCCLKAAAAPPAPPLQWRGIPRARASAPAPFPPHFMKPAHPISLLPPSGTRGQGACQARWVHYIH